jgi:predicted permease
MGTRLDILPPMLKDIRYGLRVLMQAKGWTTVVILSLAVGIGANAVIVTAANAILLRKLAVADPDSLVRLRHAGRNDMATDSSDYGFTAAHALGSVHTTFSYPMYQHLRTANKTLVDLAGSVPFARLTALIDGRAEAVSAMLVTGNFHSLMSVNPRLGRTIVPSDDTASAPPVAVLSERYWRSRFSGDVGVLGRVITIANVAVTVVGVTPAEFTGNQRPLAEPRDITLPIALDTQVRGEERLSQPTNWFVQVMGRLKPGVTVAQVQGNLEGVFRDQARAGMDAYLAGLSPAERKTVENVSRVEVPNFVAEDGSRGIYDANTNDTRALEIIAVVAVLVLLLVCANIANLLLSRATFRQRELNLRLSMGATRTRLIRQLLTESLLLAFAGGCAGILLAFWGYALLPAPIGTASAPDARVVAVMFAVTAGVGIVFGIAPALRATRLDAATSLNENSRSVAGSRAVLTRALLVAQVSIAVVLLVGAGLLLRTLENLRSVDIGYDPNNLVFVRISPSPAEDDIDDRLAFFAQGLDRLRAVPGVRAATVSVPTLLSGGVNTTGMFVQGRDYPSPRGRTSGMPFSIHRVVVAPNFFETMRIRMVAGRGFSDRDHMKAPRVAIINQAGARKFFGTENPIGKRFGSSVETSSDIEIVGVVADAHYNSLRDAPPATLYTPYLQRGPEGLVFTVRTAAEPSAVMGAIREAVARVNPNIPIVTVETQMSQIERRFAQEKVLAQAYGLFASIALFVAAIGLFGVMSYGVARRTREIGIRMAIGAQRNEVLALIVSESLVLVAAGIVIGLGAAFGAGRLIASQLFGLEPTDATTFVSATALMIVVAAAAGYLPARRATRVDPMVALRYE